MNPGGGVWHPERRGLTAALVASVTLVGSETLAVATVMPAVGQELGLGGYGLAFSLFFVGSIVGVLLAGPATDRNGAVPPFLIGMVLFAAGLIVGALAPSIVVLVSGRLLQGLGAGAIPAVGYACIGRAYPEPIQPRMLAVLSTAWVLPGVVGPGFAGLVADRAGWRWVFGGLVPLVVVIAATSLRPLGRAVPAIDPATPGPAAVPGPVAAGPVAPPVLDAVRFAGGIGLGVGAVNRLHDLSTAALAIAGAMTVGGMVLAAGPARRLLPTGWWRARRGVAAAVVARALVAYAFLAVDAFVPLVLTDLRGHSVAFASLSVSIGTLVWSAGSWLADRRVLAVGAAGLAVRGAVVVAIGLCWQLLLLVRAVPVGLALVGVAVAAFGMGLALTPLAMLVFDQQEEPNAGRASSWMALFEQLGFAFGPLLGGAMVAAHPESPGLGRGLAVSFGVASLVAVGAATLRRRLEPVVVGPARHGPAGPPVTA